MVFTDTGRSRDLIPVLIPVPGHRGNQQRRMALFKTVWIVPVPAPAFVAATSSLKSAAFRMVREAVIGAPSGRVFACFRK